METRPISQSLFYPRHMAEPARRHSAWSTVSASRLSAGIGDVLPLGPPGVPPSVGEYFVVLTIATSQDACWYNRSAPSPCCPRDAGPLGLRSRKSRDAANDGPRIRTIVFHGDADNIVHPSNAASIVGAAKEGESIERAEARHTASRAHTRTVTRDKTGKVVVEQWLIHGSGHAWSGGSRDGTYTDPQGPDASSEMLRFFLERLELVAPSESKKRRDVRYWHLADSLRELAARPLLGVRRTHPVMAQLMPLCGTA